MTSGPSNSSGALLVACRECDLLQHEITIPSGSRASCSRCGATLYRHNANGIEHALAFSVSGVLLLILANAFPIVVLDVQDNKYATTLFGAVRSLYDQDMALIAILVFVTALLIPALELIAMSYLLVPLHFGRVPRGLGMLFRFVHGARLWSMVDVFVLGILVSVVKLTSLADVVPGIALWSFACLMIALSAATTSFTARDVWARVSMLQ